MMKIHIRTMKNNLSAMILVCAVLLAAGVARGYEVFQGPTETLYWNTNQAQKGYTFFGVRGISYLVDMEGRVAHTWPVGTNPHLLDDGSVLDALQNANLSAFGTFVKVDWNGVTRWSYTEPRTNTYAPHHDFIQIYNPKLGTNTVLFIANKSVTSNMCIAAGCDPANGSRYNIAQIDAIVEVDMSTNIVWEWSFYDHLIQDFDAGKSNYVGAGKTIADYPGRLNANIPGLPVQGDWLHCNSIEYNSNLDQIVINSVRGECYVIDHGKTFVPGNLAASLALATSTNGDFVYRFGDPARYNQGTAPYIYVNGDWTQSTTGTKQMGGSHHASWIPNGFPGAGNLLIFNNAQNLREHTQQSYALEINPYLNASSNNVGTYVNPPDAGYFTWSPGNNTDKTPRMLSRQQVWFWYSKASHGMFNTIGGGAQRLSNGNTLICSDEQGHLIEVTAAGDIVWEYINPMTTVGITKFMNDSWPMFSSLFRAYRYTTNDPPLAGRTLTSGATISGRTPSYYVP